MSTQIATMEPRPRSVLVNMANKFDMEPAAFEATLRATCIKPTRDGKHATREEFAAFLLVARDYDLNPLTKEIHAFVAKGGGIVPVVGVDGWSNLINRHPQFDGMEFADALGDKGALVSVTCRMFRKDRSHPIETTEYMAECRRDTDVWKTWPRRMLRHKAMIQAARYAFGFAGIHDPDEAERIINDPADKPVKTVTLGVATALPPMTRANGDAGPESMTERAPLPPPRNVATITRPNEPVSAGIAPSSPPPEPAGQAGGGTEAKPSPDDPEAFHAYASNLLKEAKDADDLAQLWDAYIEIHAEEIFPPDYEALQAVYRQRERELDQ